MSYSFRKAVRENTSVLIALAGPSGSGKTMSALRIARGLVGDSGRIAVLDTEAGRATHYAGMFDFDHCDIRPPFSPEMYRDTVEAGEKAEYPVILIDSFSQEWSGDGGCQDIQTEALDRMSKGDAAKAERLTALAWRDAKLRHKKMMSRLLQCRAHLVFCLRAEDKIRFVKVKGDDGRERTVIEHIGFQPICEKHFMYEMTCSFLLTPDKPGFPQPIKLQEQHRAFFPLDQPISEKAGEQLAAWARGGSSPKKAQAPPAKTAEKPIAQPTGDAATLRASIMADIKSEADKRKMKAPKRAALWSQYIGAGGPDTADPSALQELLDAIKNLAVA